MRDDAVNSKREVARKQSIREDDWIQIVVPSGRSEAEVLFKRWEAEQDIRTDIIRSVDGGVFVRYRIRQRNHSAP